jgi:TonB family protein
MKLITLVVCAGLSVAAFGQQPALNPGAAPPAQAAGAPQADSSTALDKPYHVGGDVKPPKLIHSVDPDYSKEARKAKFSGVVEVYLVVDEDGNPTHVRVVRGVGMGLDEAAVKAVSQYKFLPAMKDGKPVKVEVYIDVNFQISRRWL